MPRLKHIVNVGADAVLCRCSRERVASNRVWRLSYELLHFIIVLVNVYQAHSVSAAAEKAAELKIAANVSFHVNGTINMQFVRQLNCPNDNG